MLLGGVAQRGDALLEPVELVADDLALDLIAALELGEQLAAGLGFERPDVEQGLVDDLELGLDASQLTFAAVGLVAEAVSVRQYTATTAEVNRPACSTSGCATDAAVYSAASTSVEVMNPMFMEQSAWGAK